MSWQGHTVILGRTGTGKTYHVHRDIIPSQYGKKSILYWAGGHDVVNLHVPYMTFGGMDDIQKILSILDGKKYAVIYEPSMRQGTADKELLYWQELLMRKQRNLLFVLDEAQRYAPQGSIDSGAHILATGSRKWGIECLFVCQRVAELSKTIASQCRNWTIFEHSQIDADYLRQRGIDISESEYQKLASTKYFYIKKQL